MPCLDPVLMTNVSCPCFFKSGKNAWHLYVFHSTNWVEMSESAEVHVGSYLRWQSLRYLHVDNTIEVGAENSLPSLGRGCLGRPSDACVGHDHRQLCVAELFEDALSEERYACLIGYVEQACVRLALFAECLTRCLQARFAAVTDGDFHTLGEVVLCGCQSDITGTAADDSEVASLDCSVDGHGSWRKS